MSAVSYRHGTDKLIKKRYSFLLFRFLFSAGSHAEPDLRGDLLSKAELKRETPPDGFQPSGYRYAQHALLNL